MPGECRKRLDRCPNGVGHPSIADRQATAPLFDRHSDLGPSSRTSFGSACGTERQSDTCLSTQRRSDAVPAQMNDRRLTHGSMAKRFRGGKDFELRVMASFDRLPRKDFDNVGAG